MSALALATACVSPQVGQEAPAMKPDSLHPVAGTPNIVDLAQCRLLALRAKATLSADTVRMARACAYVQDSIRRHHMQDIAAAELLRHGRIVMDIPEYHDEQRLPADTAPFLGPLVGIFTSPFLGSFRRPWQFLEHPSGAVLAAYLVVYLEAGEVLPQSYRRYNLAEGLNCLFLGRAGSGYRAWVTQPTTNQPCRPSAINVNAPNPLDVQTLSVRWPQDSIIPASRFEDDTRGNPVFGIPCLEQWCRVGLSGFQPRQNFCGWPGVNCGRKEERIPAYHDEQDWDELRPDGRWAAQSLRVAIVPQPDNNRFPSSDYSTRRHVGDLYLRGNLPTTHILYRKGVRLGKNKVELETAIDQSGNRFWQYIITPASSNGVTLEPFRVVGGGPHRHFDVAIPPTMRFRYTMLDSGIWGPCGQACCPTDGM